jgi:hypothetical protein
LPTSVTLWHLPPFFHWIDLITLQQLLHPI